MTRNLFALIFLASVAMMHNSCELAEGKEPEPITATTDKTFNDYWYDGKAEITSYTLQQARYGEIHNGEAVLIFVTEPFSKAKQVKLDNAQQNPKDAVNVMKLNFTKNFTTGIYPYTLMSSAFTPVDREANTKTLKVTGAVQDWCGHVYSQLNLKKSKYELQSFSYFESEGDRNATLGNAVLEDEIWNIIRINPDLLPTGKIDIIPGLFSARLRHIELDVETASATLQDSQQAHGILTYSLRFEESDRELNIHFKKDFPHHIQGWDETYVSGFGDDAKKLTTKAVIKKRIKSDYWNHHDKADLPMREKLELK